MGRIGDHLDCHDTLDRYEEKYRFIPLQVMDDVGEAIQAFLSSWSTSSLPKWLRSMVLDLAFFFLKEDREL